MSAQLRCCCCLKMPPDKQLKTEYAVCGKTEIYADMLKECFEINLCTRDDENGICNICINRLREAIEFKNQVQQCQRYFKKDLESLLDSNVKGENDADQSDEIKNIKYPELNNTLHRKKRKRRDDKKTDNKSVLNDLMSLDSLNVTSVKAENLERYTDEPVLFIKEEMDYDDDDDNQDYFEDKKKKPLKVYFRDFSDHNKNNNINFTQVTANVKHKTNMENIMKYSNCTPFSNKTLSGIACAYCKDIYTTTQELRTHIDNSHKNADIMDRKRLDINNLSYKVDITDLKCNICHANFNTIAKLKEHLMSEHYIKFYMEINDYILEFKLGTGDSMNCALCNSSYETFKTLLQHMNRHYRNYVCEICDQGFINKHRLHSHRKTHDVGTFNCKLCNKVFTTRVRKLCHEKYTHNTKTRYTTNCPHCEKSFNSYYQRNRHMFIEHKKGAAYRCNICEKSFILKSKLTSHIKKVHLMERDHICTVCGVGFFIKQSLDEHMIKHNGERVFKCMVCQKAYARKKTLREHMRIHNNDRRFKCGICEAAFVQKCSMKSHMLSNHGVTLAEYEMKDTSEPVLTLQNDI